MKTRLRRTENSSRRPDENLDRVIRRFDDRARLYGSMDRTVGGYTRFFEAAAWTNRVLHRVAANATFCGCSPHTLGLLMTLGGLLEAVNLALADSVPRLRESTLTCDRKLVSIEQGAADVILASFRRLSVTAYGRCIREIDDLLNRRWLTAVVWDGDVRNYGAVLKSVSRTLGMRVTFACRHHREAIGLALIAAVRNAGATRSE